MRRLQRRDEGFGFAIDPSSAMVRVTVELIAVLP
jgi:hypothetical protein